MRRAPTVAAACIGCLAFASPAGAHSGLRGKTTFGGQCGPAVSGEPPPVYRPFDVNVRIRSAETRGLVKVIRSGRDGRFRVPLASGTYIVEAGRPRETGVTYALPNGPVMVTVTEHRFPRVAFVYDNGCR